MTWYLAVCLDCTPILPQSFTVRQDRDGWAGQHETTGHAVALAVQYDTLPAGRLDLPGGWTYLGKAVLGGGGHVYAGVAGLAPPQIGALRAALARP